MSEIEQEYFKSAIEWYTEDYLGPLDGGQTTLAKMYGCSNQYINQIIRGVKRPSYKIQNKFCGVVKISRDEFLKIGEKKLKGLLVDVPKAKTTPPDELQQRKLQTHCQVVGEFENQDLAVDINRLLIDIEKIAGIQGLTEIKEYIEFKLNKAQQGDHHKPLLTGTKKNG